jgi:hypothetical protein
MTFSASAVEILYNKISPEQMQRQALRKPAWSILLDEFTRRVISYTRGYGIAVYQDGLTTAIYNGDLPEKFSLKTCADYRFTRGHFVYAPQANK